MDPPRQHLRLAQLRRMPRPNPLNPRLCARGESLLILCRHRLIVLGDEIGRGDVAPGSAGDLRSLYLVGLGDETRSLERGFGVGEIVVEFFLAA